MSANTQPASKKQAARAKLTFQEGQLTALLKAHIGAVSTLWHDVHLDIKQSVCADLVLEMRKCSPRVTAAVLQDAMADLPCKTDGHDPTPRINHDTKKRLISINHASMTAVINTGEGTTVDVPLYGLPGNATAVCTIGGE
eukprot:4233260-Amphidinium_carterae.1